MTVGNLFCVASLVCCLLLNCLDYHAEKLRLDADGSCNSVASDDELDDDNVRLTDCLAFPLTVWLIFMVTITFYAAVFVFLALLLFSRIIVSSDLTVARSLDISFIRSVKS